MGIRDDLVKAKAEYEKYIPVATAVEEIAARCDVTRREVAQWLLHKLADSELTGYVRYRASYLVEEVQRSDDKAGRRPYKAIRDYLTSIVLPERRGIFAMVEALNQWQRAAAAVTEEIAWERGELETYLQQNDISTQTPIGQPKLSAAAPIPVSIDAVAKVFVIGGSEDESLKWWKKAARGAKDRPWLLEARTSTGRGGASPMPAMFDLSKIFTGMPESVMSERSKWDAIEKNAHDLYAQHESYDPRTDRER
ncbi:hypothetical protein PQR66_19410 [Paraburkholderia agricolaris]|uniref:Uncharacterized protein n=1 Tax=Paraburkholderia agricolaris TaxID=2152888 RepID=A0ABW8ZQX6_9BURK